MADPIDPPGAVGQVLERAAEVVALAGGFVMVAVMLLSSISVLGRSLPQLLGFLSARLTPLNVPGDIEIVQLGGAVAIFCFLPYCQIRRANVFVDFFTRGIAVARRALFDLVANAVYFVLALAIAWQLGNGMREKFANRDSTMVLRLPEAWPYLFAVIAAWLLVVVVAYTVWRSFAEARTGRAIGPYPALDH